MSVGVLVGLSALAVIGGVIAARLLRGSAPEEAAAAAPTPPAPEPPPAPLEDSDDGIESPLALRPVLDDPFDAPVRSADVGVDRAPPDPEAPPGQQIAHAPLSGDSQLREHHRSESGNLRILFSKEMSTPPERLAEDEAEE